MSRYFLIIRFPVNYSNGSDLVLDSDYLILALFNQSDSKHGVGLFQFHAEEKAREWVRELYNSIPSHARMGDVQCWPIRETIDFPSKYIRELTIYPWIMIKPPKGLYGIKLTDEEASQLIAGIDSETFA